MKPVTGLLVTLTETEFIGIKVSSSARSGWACWRVSGSRCIPDLPILVQDLRFGDSAYSGVNEISEST